MSRATATPGAVVAAWEVDRETWILVPDGDRPPLAGRVRIVEQFPAGHPPRNRRTFICVTAAGTGLEPWTLDADAPVTLASPPPPPPAPRLPAVSDVTAARWEAIRLIAAAGEAAGFPAPVHVSAWITEPDDRAAEIIAGAKAACDATGIRCEVLSERTRSGLVIRNGPVIYSAVKIRDRVIEHAFGALADAAGAA